MGIQINGITDTISATDGGLAVSGQQLTGVTDINASGIVTATQVNVGTGVTIHSTNGVQVGGNLVHSTGLNINQINVTGIVTANQGYIVGTGASVFSPTANTLALGTNGSERIRITSAGLVGIGVLSPSSVLDLNGSLSISGKTTDVGAARITHHTNNYFYVRGGTAGAILSDQSGNNTVRVENSGSILFETNNGSERARIDSSGRLLIGTSASIGNNDIVLAATGNGNNFGAAAFRANANGAEINLYKSRSSTVGTNTVVQSGDTIAQFDFKGADGTNYITAASIISQVDGTSGTNDMPGRLIFSTTADGASSPTERLRIDNQGRLGLNITTQSTNPDRCFIFGSASDKYALHLSMQNNAPSGSANLSALRIDGYGGRGQGVYYGGQIDVSQIDVGTCYGLYSKVTGIYGEQFAVYGEISKDLGAFTSAFGFFSRVVTSGSGGTAYLYFGQDNTTTRFYVLQNGGIGNFQANNVNLSDRNAKKDISPASNTWDCIKQWEIVNYRYKDQPDDADLNLGVIAQQVAESCPEVITVFEEAKDDHPEKLGVKEQQMYWMAIKALQEAQQRIETLEAKVATLESK